MPGILVERISALWDALKYLGILALGLFSCLLLPVFSRPHPEGAVRNDEDSNRPTSPDRPQDLESQPSSISVDDGRQKNHIEETRPDERSSHTIGDERLSIVTRSEEAPSVPDINVPMHNNGEILSEDKFKEGHDDRTCPPPANVPDTSDDVTIGQNVEVSTGMGMKEKVDKNDELGERTPPASRPRSPGPAERPRDVHRSDLDSDGHPPSNNREDENHGPTEHRPGQRSVADNVIREQKREVDQPTPNRSFIFENEVARRFFLGAADAYTEKETIDCARSLNDRINSLSAHLINEKNRIRALKKNGSFNRGLNVQDSKNGRRHDDNNRLAELVRTALGSRLHAELLEVGQNGKTSDDNDATIRDGLDTWAVFCAYLAMKPMLFGLKLRSVSDIEEIFRHMVDHEPELAQYWNQIRLDKSPEDVDPRIKSLVRGICPLTQPQTGDLEEYAVLEEIYRTDFAYVQHRQIALHWRAMLHKHELGLTSYKKAITETQEILSQGLLRVFAMARVEPPNLSQKSFRDMIGKVVKDAATLAEHTRTGIFSQSIEAVFVESGTSFNRDSMRSADERDAGEVKCTIRLGLKAIDSEGLRGFLFMPEVLLA